MENCESKIPPTSQVINPNEVCFYHPPEITRGAKLELFHRIGNKIVAAGGRTTREWTELDALSPAITPIVGCSPQLTAMIGRWRSTGRRWIYWDRGYFFRCYATWLPRGTDGGMYRWHVGSFQLSRVDAVPPERLNARRPPVRPWQANGRHIVIAKPSKTYCRFHAIDGWLDKTIYDLSLITERQLVVRDKESKRPLADDLAGAHALVTHGSIAAVEAVILGTPVFVHATSAAALVGQTDLSKIEHPVYPDREPWLRALAYTQFNEQELVDGTLWRMLQ